MTLPNEIKQKVDRRNAQLTFMPKLRAYALNFFDRGFNFDEIGNYFPADMPLLTPEERRQAIGIRQLHVQRRYRSF